MPISLDSASCRNFDTSVASEWLLTNGLGGYASGTVAGVNTRKYHGLLVVAAKPPVQRYVVLSRVEDRVILPASSSQSAAIYDLSSNEFADIIHPQGYKHLLSFDLGGNAAPGSAVWRYSLGDAGILEKSVTLLHDQDALILRYQLLPPTSAGGGTGAGGGGGRKLSPVKLQLQPMLAGRDFHHTIELHNRPWWTIVSDEKSTQDNMVILAAPECPVRLMLSHNADKFHVNACWWYNFTFRMERARGYPDHEDLWTPGFLEYILAPGTPVGFIASTRGTPWARHDELAASARRRHEEIARTFSDVAPADSFLSDLAVAADQFIVHRAAKAEPVASARVLPSAGRVENQKSQVETSAGASVIAGYPWFEDWGRDTFISLCGLTLVTRRFELARAILATFADHMRRGLLPNRFPDKDVTPDYNTVDASLWFVHAAYQYWRYTGDVAFLTKYLYPKLCEVIECYRDGTDFGIRMESSGLIRAGDGNHQPTWMDAKIGDWVVTPRHGKPVEINALWYSNLRFMALLAARANDDLRATTFQALAWRVLEAFERSYFNPQTKFLHDVIADDGTPDPSLRPNQLLAVALPFSPLTLDTQIAVVQACQRYLLTPMGLRTLAPPPPPGSPAYHGQCAGDQPTRDMAYHQGTVWPWLIGPFVTAFIKARSAVGNLPQARQEARAFIEPFLTHLSRPGAGALGSISEVADGDSPHTPRGCPAQAWSVGEVLRAYYEDILARAPQWPHESESVGLAPAGLSHQSAS